LQYKPESLLFFQSCKSALIIELQNCKGWCRPRIRPIRFSRLPVIIKLSEGLQNIDFFNIKFCLYKTRPRSQLGGNKLKSFIQSAKANAEHDFSLFYLDQRRQASFAIAVAFCINRPLGSSGYVGLFHLRLNSLSGISVPKTKRHWPEWKILFVMIFTLKT